MTDSHDTPPTDTGGDAHVTTGATDTGGDAHVSGAAQSDETAPPTPPTDPSELAPKTPPAPDSGDGAPSDGPRRCGETPACRLELDGDPDGRVTVEVCGGDDGQPVEVFALVDGTGRQLCWRGDRATAVSIELGDGQRAYLRAHAKGGSQ